MLNYIAARNEVRQLFYNKWIDGITNGLPHEVPALPPLTLHRHGALPDADPYIPHIQWQNVEYAKVNDNGVHWCRFSMFNVNTRQSAFGVRKTRYTTIGVVVIQLFFSKSAHDTNAEEHLSMVAHNAFLGTKTPGGVWFRDPTIVELPPEETHFRANVTANYEYDSLRV